ncbi:MAG: hypothetical protein MJ126_06435 [Lachnospiraceae bacterium]|nr:hypothetical protein [Lachnospiraceae bacterium]
MCRYKGEKKWKKTRRITKQLRDKYGIKFIAENARGARGKDFIVKSLESVNVYGSTDLFGNVKTGEKFPFKSINS